LHISDGGEGGEGGEENGPRVGFSAAANMAEGAAKRGSREFRRYLDIALGSLAETAYLFETGEGSERPADWATLDGLRKRVVV
jgi:four helix bundle protein